jgi:ribonuclease-3
VFLDGGFDAAQRLVEVLFERRIAELPAPASLKDAKTRLQEYLQSRGLALPRYSVESVEGEAHAQTFHVTCEVVDLGRQAQGSGLSRRRAEQEAAERILQDIQTP